MTSVVIRLGSVEKNAESGAASRGLTQSKLAEQLISDPCEETLRTNTRTATKSLIRLGCMTNVKRNGSRVHLRFNAGFRVPMCRHLICLEPDLK